MTDRQRIALAHPCFRAVETIHNRFRRIDGGWSTILSVNK